MSPSPRSWLGFADWILAALDGSPETLIDVRAAVASLRLKIKGIEKPQLWQDAGVWDSELN